MATVRFRRWWLVSKTFVVTVAIQPNRSDVGTRSHHFASAPRDDGGYRTRQKQSGLSGHGSGLITSAQRRAPLEKLRKALFRKLSVRPIRPRPRFLINRFKVYRRQHQRRKTPSRHECIDRLTCVRKQDTGTITTQRQTQHITIPSDK